MGCATSMSRLICADCGELVLGFGVLEGVFEFALPVGVGRERKAFGHAALGVELQQLVRHVAHFGFDARFGFRPGGAAEPVEGRLRFSRAAIFLDQIQARQRNVELRFAGVFEQHEVALLIALHDLANAEKLSDAVRGVDHEVAGLEIGDVGGKRGQLRFGWLARDQVRGIEKIFRADDGQFRIGKHRAAPDTAFDQVGARDCAGMISALSERGPRTGSRFEPQLVRHRIFLQYIGQAFQFANRRSEKGDSIAGAD